MNREKALQIIGALVFAGIVITALAFFFTSVFSLTTGYLEHAPVITYKRGMWAMLGVALALSSVLTWVLYENATGHAPEGTKAKLIGRLTVAGLALMLILPLASRPAVGLLLEGNGYTICEEAAYPYHLPGMGEKVYVAQREFCLPWEQFRQTYQR